MKEPVIFSTYAHNEEQLHHAVILAESIRSFCGEYRHAPIWIYVPSGMIRSQEHRICYLGSLNAEVIIAPVPSPATINMFYSGKVFAAAAAEEKAQDLTKQLVWMDDDTIFLQQPDDLMLPIGKVFGYRPVMHNRSGVQWESTPNHFWNRIYRLFSIDESMLFPMITPGDQVEINPYFNAGLVVVRPEQNILRRWVSCFELLCSDPEIVGLCLGNSEHRIFVHQTALVGAVLPFFQQAVLHQLPHTLNYPLFFDRMYRAHQSFENISDKISVRYDGYFRNPAPDWADQLKGDKNIVTWLRKRLG